MRFVDVLGGGGKLLRLARSKNQECVAVLALQGSKRDKRQRLFARDYAPGNDNRRTAATLHFALQPIRERGRQRKLRVIFRIAACRNPLRRRSEEHTSELQSRGHLVC